MSEIITAAGYQLNEEVKAPTPALKRASQIGLRVNSNPAFKDAEDKDAILVMCFGTTYIETRTRNIDATVEAIAAKHPDVKIVVAYTSHIVIKRIKENEGITFPTPEEALQQLKAEGYTRVAMTSLDIIPGMEYDYDAAVYNVYKDEFKKATLAMPLMYWQGQEGQTDDVKEVMKAFATQCPVKQEGKAILAMAHGTPHPANAYYCVMQNRLEAIGRDDILIYSVEGWPHLDTIIPMLKQKGVQEVLLMPLMLVAGDHANNDMAGDEEDSHKTVLESEGIKVEAYLHGLGENAAIRDIFVARAEEAWAALVE